MRLCLFSIIYKIEFSFLFSAEYADMNRGQLLAKIHELEEVSESYLILRKGNTLI